MSSLEDESRERALEQLCAATSALLDADPRTDSDIVSSAWPNVSLASARRHITALRRGTLWLGAAKAQQLADTLGVELKALYGDPDSASVKTGEAPSE